MTKSLYDLIVTRRTIRQFKPEALSRQVLEKMVDAARLAPSAANRQPLEYVIVDNSEVCRKIFPCLRWAGYIKPRGNPKPGQEPAAYIIILVNTEINSKEYIWDAGASIEHIILTAWEVGIGSCWLLSIEREPIRDILKVPEKYLIDSVVALGYPAEQPQVEDLVGSDSVKYWLDDAGRLHVPKRKLEDITHYNSF